MIVLIILGWWLLGVGVTIIVFKIAGEDFLVENLIASLVFGLLGPIAAIITIVYILKQSSWFAEFKTKKLLL